LGCARHAASQVSGRCLDLAGAPRPRFSCPRLFVYASRLNWLTISNNADARIGQALDVVQEQALKVFETIELTLADADDILAGLSDDEIRAREESWHGRLEQVADRLPQTGSIIIIDKTGHLASQVRAFRCRANLVSRIAIISRRMPPAVSRSA
jgi:hypothetical protein